MWLVYIILFSSTLWFLCENFILTDFDFQGVSTCGQVASLKLIMNDDVVGLLNKNLPSDIRVFCKCF